MKLRKLNYYKGFYSDLNNGFFNLIDFKVKQCLPKKERRIFYFKKDFESLNYLILKNLRSSSRISPLVSGKMEISKSFQTYLAINYNIFNKFKNASEILKDNNFLIERYYNETDYCTIFENLLKIRVGNPRKLNFFPNEQMQPKQIYYKTILYYKFTVDNRKIATN